ncbi:hypothetical protein DF186_21215, partial [Enterococcus hirae]
LKNVFLKTSRFKLNTFLNTYSFKINKKTVNFNLNKTMKHPPKNHFIFQYNIINKTVTKIHQKTINKKNTVQNTNMKKPPEYT